jgi:hypothetical protein
VRRFVSCSAASGAVPPPFPANDSQRLIVLHKSQIFVEKMVKALTTLRRGNESPVEIRGLGASAQALPFRDYLVENPERVLLLHGSGVPVLVPQPARYGIHMLIDARLRPTTEGGKRAKDLAQASAIREALLSNNPDAWNDALDDARARGAKWAKHVDASLSVL